MSGFLKRETRTVNPAGGVNPASSPNVGQYGWTSFDAGNVNQIIEYVNICKEYAERSKDSADYVASKFGELESFIEYIETIYNQIGPIFSNIDLIYKDVVLKHSEVTSMHKDVQAALMKVLQSVTDAHNSAVEAHGEAVKSEISADASAKSAVDSEASNTGAKSWYDKAYDIYLDLKAGQVYRGTWNPKTMAYPDPQGTNSVWDVVLDIGTNSVVFDGKTWHSGDRLVYVVASGKFDQISAGSSVTSVNGKSGAVDLTAFDVKAIPLDGSDAMLGALYTPGVNFTGNDGAIFNNEAEPIVQSTRTFGSTLFGSDKKNTYIVFKDNLHARKGAIDYKVYHEGFKPTAADVGAVGKTGNQSMSGALYAVKFIANDSYAFVSSLRPNQGIFLGNNANDRRVIIGGGGDTVGDATGAIHFRPNGITDSFGEVIIHPSGQISAPTNPTDGSHLVNLYHMNTAVKGVEDKIAAITADSLGAMPKSGGTFAGQVSGETATMGAFILNDKASVMFRDGSNAWFHQQANENTIRWSQGAQANTTLMVLDGGGALNTEGPQFAKTANAARNSEQTGWIAIEAPDNDAPYISTKAPAEGANSVALRFGQTEVSVESGKRMASGNYRVGNDGGLMFAPTNDLSGLTWGMGVNPDSRTLGVYKYVDGAYSGQWMEFNNTTGIHLRAPVFADGRVTINTAQGLDIRSSSHNIVQYHQPASSAIITYKPVDRVAFRVAGSNGEFTESGMIADLDGANAQFAGSVRSNFRSNRGWTNMSVASFHSPQQDVGDGHLLGLTTGIAHYPGHHILEYGHGIMNSSNAETGANVFWANDGGNFNRVWYFYSNGSLSGPSFHITNDGNLWGSIWGNTYISSWVQGHFAPISDINHKTILGESKLSAVEQIDKMKFHEFVWKDSEATKALAKRSAKVNRIGVIAQELEAIDPTYTRDIETYDKEGNVESSTKTLDTANLLAVALKAIQEQQVQINELKEKLNEFILK